MSKTHNDLLKLVESYREALDYWIKCLDPRSEELSQIKAANVDQPLDELVKLGKLIKAHTTKVGIIFKPSVLKDQSESAFNTLSKLSETIILIVSIIPQLDSQVLSHIYTEEIVSSLRLIVMANTGLANELEALVKEELSEGAAEKNDQDNRLISVGQIWSSCDDLLALIQNGKLGFLSHKTKENISLIEDGLEDFEEWAESPEDFDDDDPFGLSDSESDSEDEPPTHKQEDPSDDDDTRSKLIEYAKKWLQKIKLIKLLLNSLAKSLPANTQGAQIDSIYQVERHLVNLVDKLIVDLMLDHQVDGDVEEYATSIDKACTKIVSIVKGANKSSEPKLKWCNDWHTKYSEL